MMMNNCVRSEVLRENFRPGTDTVAAIMWSNPVVLPPLCRVNEAIERVRQVGLPGREHEQLLCGGGGLHPAGAGESADAAADPGGARLETVMSHPFATVQPQDDQELAAQLMQEYDLLELPGGGRGQPPDGRGDGGRRHGGLAGGGHGRTWRSWPPCLPPRSPIWKARCTASSAAGSPG